MVCGSWPSMLIPPTVLPDVALPARSLAGSLVTLWLTPSPLSSLSLGQLATPDPFVPSASFGSVQEKPTMTSLLYQPAALGLVVGAPLITGPLRSILMPLADSDVELPALSETLTGPAPRWEPSPVMTSSAGEVAGSIPDNPSMAVQWIATSPRYHPAPLASVVGAPLKAGAVRSMLMSLTVVSLVLPAPSSAVPSTDWPAPSFSSVTGGVQPAMPDSASEQSKVTVTGVLFQPKPLGSGRRLPVMVGGTPSIRSVIEWPEAVLSSVLPARSTLQKRISWTPLAVKLNASA